MPKAADPENRVRRLAEHIEQMVSRLPGGAARLLWNRVILLQTNKTDLSVGLYLACAGALVEQIGPTAPSWDETNDPAFYEHLTEHLKSSDPRLLTQPVEGLGPHSLTERWGFRFIQAGPDTWATAVEPGAAVIFIDGVTQILDNPETFLRTVHRLGAEGCLVELAACPGEHVSARELDILQKAALAEGFGIRFHTLRRPDLDNSSSTVPPLVLGLLRLAEPLSDHPVADDPVLMSHTQARLDVAAQLVKGAKVLDAGGWAGFGAERFLKAGATHVVTLDISASALEKGQERLGENERASFQHWDLNITPYPFDDASFDVIICMETLEHITNHTGAVAEFQRLLRPDGHLLISIPDHEFEKTWASINRYENPFHLHVPTRDDIANLLGDFSHVRWLRQVDVAGSIVIEEGRRKKKWTGEYEIRTDWKPEHAVRQVVMALAEKALPPDAANETKKRKTARSAISSHLRVHNNATSLQAPSLARQRELEAEATEARYVWWSKCNALQQEAYESESDATASNDAAQTAKTHEAEAKARANAADEKANNAERLLQTMCKERDQALAETTRLQAQLDSRQAEFIQIQEQHNAMLADLKAEHDRLRQTISNLTKQKELAEQSLENAKDRREERAEIMMRLDRIMGRTISEVERRCLTVESRMYDLEELPSRATPDGTPHQ